MTAPTAAPADRAFAFFRRGEQREEILTGMRYRLAQLINPVTGQPFQQSEIAAATAVRSRWWNGADALDLVLLAGQARGLLLADQVRPDRANSEFLVGFHGKRLGIEPLPASGGSGGLNIVGTAGVPFIGSTTIGDPAANYFTDPAGLRYQVLYSDTIAPSGTGLVSGNPLFVQAVDTGTATNIAAGTLLKPANGPVGYVGPATVAYNFTGGNPAETDAQFGRRIAWMERHKRGCGNAAEIREWIEDSTNAVETGFVYMCGLQAGSFVVCVTQKRGTVQGPGGRMPSVGTLTAARAAVTPPGSPNLPGHPYGLVVAPVPQAVNLVSRLALPKQSSSGWEDLHPWPTSDATGTATTITTLTSQTDFQVTIPSDSQVIPSGVTQPALMVWNATTSRFERLQVSAVTLVSGQVYHVVLTNAPTTTLAAGSYICPSTKQRDVIAQTTEAYFDTLGPGELVDFSGSTLLNATTLLSHRAARFPAPSEEFVQQAGSTLLTMFDDALGSALGNRDLPYISTSTPALPADPSVGPSLLVAGNCGFYPL